MSGFWQQYQENVREYRRTWKRRLLRRVVAILLVILITPIAMLVRYVTGSNAAGAIVGVPLMVFAVFLWWWIEDRLYADADARYYAELDAREAQHTQQYSPPPGPMYAQPASNYAQPMPPTPPNYSAAVPATVIEDAQPAYIPVAQHTAYQPMAPAPKQPMMQPPPTAGGGRGALIAIAIVATVFLMCGGMAGAGALMISRAAQGQRTAFERADDRFAEMRQRHEDQMEQARQRHEEIRQRMERDRERMRRPGW